MNRQHVILAEYRFEEQYFDSIVALVSQMKEASLLEPGCLSYIILRSEVKTRLFLYEVYEDEVAVQAHRASAHFKEIVIGKILPLLSERIVHVLTPV